MSRRPRRAVIDGLGAFTVLVVLLVGVPSALALLAGWPLPRRLPDRELLEAVWRREVRPEAVFFLKAFACLFWSAWSIVAWVVLRNVAAAIGNAPPPDFPVIGVTVARLVAAAALLVAGERRAPVPPAAALAEPMPVIVEVPAAPAVSAVPPAAGLLGQTVRAQPKWVLVVENDNLWDLADKHLGDPRLCVVLADLIRDVPQPDGLDPIRGHGTLIHPGQIVLFPDEATGTRVGPLPENAPPELVARAASLLPAGHGTEPVPPGTAGGRPMAHQPPADPPATEPAAMPAPLGAPADAQPGRVVVIKVPSGYSVAASFAAGVAATVAFLRLRARRRYVPSPPTAGLDTSPCPLPPTIGKLVEAAHGPRDAEDPVPVPTPAWEPVHRLSPAPAAIEIGADAAGAVTVDLAQGGIVLVGPGAEPTARYLAVALVTHGRPEDVEVVMDAATAAGLFGAVSGFPGLGVVADVEAVLELAEVELVRRSRLFEGSDAEDFGQHRRAYPEEPMPALVLLLSDVPERWRGRLAAVLEQGSTRGLGAILLSPAGSAAMRVETDAEALVVHTEGGGAPEPGTRLHGLGRREAADVLAVVGRCRGPADATEDGPLAPTPAQPETFVVPQREGSSRPLRARMLGGYVIEAAEEEVQTGLRSGSREQLAWFLLRPEGATREAAIDAVWPDADKERGQNDFWNALSNLRRRLRPAAGDTAQVIARVGDGRYRVETDLFEVDVWAFEAALGEAASSTGEPAAAASALRRALDAYGGDLLPDAPYEWAEPSRADLRRRALDAAVRLAELEEDAGDIEGASRVLDRALTIDPYAEELYRRAIRLAGLLQRPDIARALFGCLRERLAEIDADPDPETERVLAEAVRQGQRRRAPAG